MESKLELLDLHDYVLFEIIDKLDHESKKEMMETCKRFEGLIGQTRRFYKNFKFRYDHDEESYYWAEWPRNFRNIRRKFEIAEVVTGGDSYYRSDLKRSVLDALKRIGAKILKIKIENLKIENSDFMEVMKALPKVRELEINEIRFKETGPCENFADFELKHLKKLDINQPRNFRDFAKIVPSSLKTLKYKVYHNQDDEPLVAELLGKQKSLEELSIKNCNLTEFKFESENCRIKKLEIEYIGFLNDPAFEKFQEFLLIQKSVTEL
jgi:hypothetical protein